LCWRARTGIVTSTVFTAHYLPHPRLGFNKFNGLASRQNAAREPLLAGCDNAAFQPRRRGFARNHRLCAVAAADQPGRSASAGFRCGGLRNLHFLSRPERSGGLPLKQPIRPGAPAQGRARSTPSPPLPAKVEPLEKPRPLIRLQVDGSRPWLLPLAGIARWSRAIESAASPFESACARCAASNADASAIVTARADDRFPRSTMSGGVPVFRPPMTSQQDVTTCMALPVGRRSSWPPASPQSSASGSAGPSLSFRLFIGASDFSSALICEEAEREASRAPSICYEAAYGCCVWRTIRSWPRLRRGFRSPASPPRRQRFSFRGT
jgi:hypothetical protein